MLDYIAKPLCLKGKNILVSGAGSGLGQAAALAYARHGAQVILLGRTESKLDATYDQIVAEGGAEPVQVVLDLQRASEQDYQEVTQVLTSEIGQLHGLLHSAAVSAPALPLQYHNLGTWNQLLQVNLTASFALTQCCLPLLQQAEHASVVFTSSRAGRETRAFWGAYSISKHGVEALMQIFAEELGTTTSIRVNSLNPGPCATDLRRVIFPSEDPAKVPQADTLMPVYLYLMSDDSLHENGQRFSAQDESKVY